MVRLVLVSHSRALAEAVRRMVLSMCGGNLLIGIAAGAGENRAELGTDATEILGAIEEVYSDSGVVVLMDMGSALLSAELALDLLDESRKSHVFLCGAAFVEGSIAAGVTAKSGAPVEKVIAEALGGASIKESHLSSPSAPVGGSMMRVELRNREGLHARPAAALVREAARFPFKIQIRNITNGKGPASAASLTSILGLEARYQHELELSTPEEAGAEALEELKAFIESGMGDSVEMSEPASALASCICEGIAIGPLYRPSLTAEEPEQSAGEGFEAEKRKLRSALSNAAIKLQRRIDEVTESLGATHGDIFRVQVQLLQDPQLLSHSESILSKTGSSAGAAWRAAINAAVSKVRESEDSIHAARAMDLQDAGQAVLCELGSAHESSLNPAEPSILLVDDLTPSQVTNLDQERVLGVICLDGGNTSHAAILLRARGMAAIGLARNVYPALATLPQTDCIAMDALKGEIFINPDQRKIASLESRQKQQQEEEASAAREASRPLELSDGRTISIVANVGSLSDAAKASANAAEGIGLLRTEFLFLNRLDPPGEEEQLEGLLEIARAMPSKPIKVRTLDAGGDKELPYLEIPKEDNPFLGMRGVRLSLANLQLFQIQLRAILRAGAEHDIQVMFPMVAALWELEEAKRQLRIAHESLLSEKRPHRWPVPTGIMIEVPSAALQIEKFAHHINFASIGTNDLAQYVLAAERGNPLLHRLSDPLDEAVLALIGKVAEVCGKHRISCSVCGEAAGDERAARVFIDLGVTELSMSPRLIPRIKECLRR